MRDDLERHAVGRAVPEAGRPADGHGAGAEEEAVAASSRESHGSSEAAQVSGQPARFVAQEASLQRRAQHKCEAVERAGRGASTVQTRRSIHAQDEDQERRARSASACVRAAPSSAARRSSATSSPRRPPRTSASCAAPTAVHETNMGTWRRCCRSLALPTIRSDTMPRVKRGVTARARHKKVLDQAKGYPRPPQERLPHRQASGDEGRPVRLPRPPQQEARVPRAVDRPYQRRRARARHDLQRVHERPEARRGSTSTARCWPTSPCTTRPRLRRSWSRSRPARLA